mgnify:CR=1 FL=1
MKKRRVMRMSTETRIFTRAEFTEDGKNRLSKVIKFGNGKKVEIPINRDGSVRWFDDLKLIRK